MSKLRAVLPARASEWARCMIVLGCAAALALADRFLPLAG